jgi:Cu+-exporting ATPase
MEERERRRVAYEIAERRVMDSVICPRIKKVAEFFPNAKLSPATGTLNSHLLCQFDKVPDFPATTSLRFAISPDADVRNAILTYDLEILPIYFQFQGHDQLVMPLGEIDDRCVGQWVESKLLGFMDAYVRLQTLDQYQIENRVTDPVCGMQINRAAAVGDVEYDGRRYYFCHDECRQRFVADPQSFLSKGTGQSSTPSVRQSQQAELKRESAALKDLGREIQEVKSRVEKR